MSPYNYLAHSMIVPKGQFFQKTNLPTGAEHSEVEWDFWFVNFLWCNPVQKQDFCIPLRFLGIKDLKKIEKGQRNF